MHKRLLPLASCLVLFCVSTHAHAQILNIEKKRIDQDDDNYFAGNLGVHFNFNNRSPSLESRAKVMNTGLSSHVGYFSDNNAYMMIHDYQLLVINDNEIVNTGYSHFRAQFNRNDTLSYEVFGQGQYDRPRGLGLRWLVGAGPRLRLLHSDVANLTAGVGAMYEMESWQHPFMEGVVLQARFIKANSYVSTRIELNEFLDFNGVVYFQTGYDREYAFFRHRVSGDLNLTVKLSRWLSLTSSVSASYENRPIVPIIHMIYSTMNGVRLNF